MVKCAPLFYYNTSGSWKNRSDVSFNNNIFVSKYNLDRYSSSWILELVHSRGWRNKRKPNEDG